MPGSLVIFKERIWLDITEKIRLVYAGDRAYSLADKIEAIPLSQISRAVREIAFRQFI